MKKIPLTQGKFALVDDEDYDEIVKFKWCASTFGNTYCAVRSIRRNGGKCTTVYMHRAILNTPIGMHTDHVNGNGLDNRRSNIRECTNAENQRSQRISKKNTSGATGVTFNKNTNKWKAQIVLSQKTIYLGLFESFKEAKIVRRNAELLHFGRFASENRRTILSHDECCDITHKV